MNENNASAFFYQRHNDQVGNHVYNCRVLMRILWVGQAYAREGKTNPPDGKTWYSRTCIYRPLLGPLKHGRYRQVVAVQKHC